MIVKLIHKWVTSKLFVTRLVGARIARPRAANGSPYMETIKRACTKTQYLQRSQVSEVTNNTKRSEFEDGMD